MQHLLDLSAPRGKPGYRLANTRSESARSWSRIESSCRHRFRFYMPSTSAQPDATLIGGSATRRGSPDTRQGRDWAMDLQAPPRNCLGITTSNAMGVPVASRPLGSSGAAHRCRSGSDDVDSLGSTTPAALPNRPLFRPTAHAGCPDRRRPRSCTCRSRGRPAGSRHAHAQIVQIFSVHDGSDWLTVARCPRS